MTTGGWIMMISSVSLVTGLFIGCLWKVLRGGGQKVEHLHGFDIDTKDTEND